VLSALRGLVRKASRFRPYRAARVAITRPLGARGQRSLAVLLAGIFAIVLWQSSFAGPQAKLDNSYKITAASGVHHDRSFTYFLYYLNLFPVVSTTNIQCTNDAQPGCWDSAGTPGDFTYEAANRVLTTHGNSLQQDLGWTWYSGDRGKIYLYLFDAWLKGAPWNPTPTPASRFGFIVALSLLYASLWWVRRPVLGAMLVLFLGSNPFQLFEVHGRPNVFGLNISIAILLLAIHVPLLQRWYRPNPKWVFLWPVGVGLLMATLRTVRSEPMPMLLAAVGTYLLVTALSWKRRAALVGVLVASFWLGGTLWNHHFLRQQQRSAQVIAQHGGHPYPTDFRLYHHVWHPIWCGLGDFGEKYGYVWDDLRAAAYAKPILESKGVYVPSGFFVKNAAPQEYLDPETKLYKKLPYDIPFYNDVIRDKVLSDIKHDPVWYIGVLAKRVHRIFTTTTPVRVSWSTGWLNVPWHAVMLLPLVVLLALCRSRFLLGLSLFTLPSVTTAFVIYSDRGITFYGIFHIVAFAVVASIVVSHALFWGDRALRRRERARTPSPSATALAAGSSDDKDAPATSMVDSDG
jgi:hypothetical protein